eukprot:1185060-Rhodomonas_salina.1
MRAKFVSPRSSVHTALKRAPSIPRNANGTYGIAPSKSRIKMSNLSYLAMCIDGVNTSVTLVGTPATAGENIILESIAPTGVKTTATVPAPPCDTAALMVKLALLGTPAGGSVMKRAPPNVSRNLANAGT